MGILNRIISEVSMDYGGLVTKIGTIIINFIIKVIPNNIKKAAIKIYKKINMPFFSILLILLASSVSFNATYQGFLSFFSSIEGGNWITVWNPFIITVIIQLSILLSVWNLKENSIFLKPLWLVIYILVVFVSVGFGYAFWFDIMRADDFSKEISSETTLRITQPVEQFLTKYEEIQDIFISIALESEALALKEKNEGATCHLNVPRGPGQMMQYRKEDSDIFKPLASKIQFKSSRIKNAAEKILKTNFNQSSVDEQKKRLSSFINRISGSYTPEQDKILYIDILRHRLKKANTIVSSKVIIKGSIQTINVPLCLLDVQNKKNHIRSIKNLSFPEAPKLSDIVLIDTSNKRAVLNYAFSGLIVNITKMLRINKFFFNKKETDILYKFSLSNFIPLFLGLLIDILILLFTIRKSRFNKEIDGVTKAISILPDNIIVELGRFYKAKNDYREKFLEVISSTSLLQKKFIFSLSRFLVIPSNINRDSDLFIVGVILNFFQNEKLVLVKNLQLHFEELEAPIQRHISANNSIYGSRHAEAFYDVYLMEPKYYNTLAAGLLIHDDPPI